MQKQILLIDDDEDELYIFREAIIESASNCQCLFAASVEEGIEILKKVWTDFIFLDINLPKVSGLEGLAAIRELKIFPETPVIMYSTAINDEVAKKALALGATASIKKADSVKSLAASLNNLFKEFGTVK